MSGCDLETFRHAIYVHIFPVYFTAQVSYISLKLTNSKIKNHFTHTRTHLVTHTSTRLVCVCVCVLSVCVVKCKHLNQKRGPASQPASLKGRKGVSGIRGCTVCWRVWIPLTLCALFVQHVAHCPSGIIAPRPLSTWPPPTNTNISRGKSRSSGFCGQNNWGTHSNEENQEECAKVIPFQQTEIRWNSFHTCSGYKMNIHL